MPDLRAVTVCLWMKTTDQVNDGTPLSYTVPRYKIYHKIIYFFKSHFPVIGLTSSVQNDYL